MDGTHEIVEGKREKHTGFVRICEGKRLLENLGIEGRIISE